MPVLFRLYRTKRECADKGHLYRKKTELVRELLDVLVGWTDGRRLEVAADSASCNDTVLRDLPDSVVFFVAMRPDAVLTALPDAWPGPKVGRRRKRGQVLPKPEKLARDGRRPWQTCETDLYGQRRTLSYKDCHAQWYRACGTRLLHIVVVVVPHGAVDLRVFFSTDPTTTVEQILEGYAGRRSIEVAFRDLKQFLGFGASTARKKAAVERMASFVGLSFSLRVVWFAQHAYATRLVAIPMRPWYRQRRNASFADVLWTAQRVLAPLDVLDPRCRHDNLCQLPLRRPVSSRTSLRRAA